MNRNQAPRIAYALGVAALSLAWVAQGQQQAPPSNQPAPNQPAPAKTGALVLSSKNFTGGDVTTIENKYTVATAHYRFGPGARTKWHVHSGGQVVFNEEGVSHYQNKGGPVRELKAGESYYVPPGVWHWHGSAPGQSGTQFNMTFGDITWGDTVTDAEYNAKPKKK